ncbi:neutral amino acid transporter A-like [Pomacea canaliculata]|uniref:neutral amino acid transporter A-like n=1 Tax=Pomacea canaliculata TaxID=400727 RepID=UPI000D73E455|nr:neutral amino acid transporter A-like [Pomacea canaliculata]
MSQSLDLNLVPDNLVTATFQQSQTQYREVQAANGSTDNATVVLERFVSTGGGANALGLVVACAALGMAASQSKKTGEPFLAFFRSCSEVITLLLHRIIWFTPVGVSSLIASSVASTKNVLVTVRGLGLFVLSETLGNVVLAIGVSPLLYFLVVRRNPFSLLVGASRAVIAGVAPPSSAIALPEIIKYLEEKVRVDHRVSRFVVPFAVTLNRDGSVMFITLTSLYIAQLQGDVTADVIVLVILLATASSLAIPAIPSASFVTILLILSSINVTPANIGILMAIEWFSDRIRTGANVVSHIVCGAITNKLCMTSLMATDLLQTTPLRHVEKMVIVEEPDSEKDESHQTSHQ